MASFWLSTTRFVLRCFSGRWIWRRSGLHSATKYLNGHSDMVGGIVVAGESALAESMGFLQNSVGAVAGPFDSFLAMRD